MRTTIRLDDELLGAAKEKAARDRMTLTSLIEGALRQALARSSVKSAEPWALRRMGDAETLPGVDLDDSAALRELMDGLR